MNVANYLANHLMVKGAFRKFIYHQKALTSIYLLFTYAFVLYLFHHFLSSTEVYMPIC